MNLAALYHLPVLFICENNLYASHMPLLERRAKDNIGKAGEAHGVPSLTLDGNDAVAVYLATVKAVAQARRGEGPTLLECRTYRWRGHVGPSWDMDVGVQRKDELKDWLPKDPIARVRQQLFDCGGRSEKCDRMAQTIRQEIEDAVIFARESPYPPESELLDHVYWSDNQR
jgi:TPP-dependent pyruvate/acetoin dehydrogenase alpha subunit